jgi:hypothetical protein
MANGWFFYGFEEYCLGHFGTWEPLAAMIDWPKYSHRRFREAIAIRSLSVSVPLRSPKPSSSIINSIYISIKIFKVAL